MRNIFLFNIVYQFEKPFPDAEGFYMATAYNERQEYIGNIKTLENLLKHGIIPELIPAKIKEKNTVCSIGKSVKDNKWYGWSHRAMHGFQVGDKIKQGDCAASSGWTQEYLDQHPEEDRSLPIGFEAKTEADCKRMAIAFAESVS